MYLIAISFCPSNFFSITYLWTNIPSVVPIPCLNSSCSSTISPYTIAFILPSRIRSSNLNCFPGSCTSPFLFYIQTISPVLYSAVNFPSLLQVFSNCFVDHLPTRSATATATATATVYTQCLFIFRNRPTR